MENFLSMKINFLLVNYMLELRQFGKFANYQGTPAGVSKAFHRYALNYINALNYLETLRRHHEFAEFEKVAN